MRRSPIVRWPSSGLDPRLRARDVLREPAAVGDRDEPVLLAVPDEHRDADRRDVEAPRPDEARSSSNQPSELGSMPTAIWASANSASAPVSTSRSAGPRIERQASSSCSGVTPLTAASSSSCCGRCAASPARAAADRRHVLLAHARREVEAVRVERRDRRERRRGRDAIGQQRRERERVRAAARDAPRQQPLDPERVADRGHVRGARGDVAARPPRREPVARPVVRQQPDPARRRVVEVRLVEQARPGRAVVDEHRHAAGIAALAQRQRPPVGRIDRPQRLHRGASLRRSAAAAL